MKYQKTRPDRRCTVIIAALIINLVILSLLTLSTSAFAAKSYQITIVYTNDVRGETDPCGWGDNRHGGLARKATYIKKLKQEKENLLILDSGDLLFKDYYLDEPLKKQLRLKADMIIESFNRIGCSAFNIGDYDLALGVKYLMKKTESAKFPFLSANLTDKNTGKPLFQPYIIKDINGLKIKIDDMEYKLDKFIERIDKLEERLSRLGQN